MFCRWFPKSKFQLYKSSTISNMWKQLGHPFYYLYRTLHKTRVRIDLTVENPSAVTTGMVLRQTAQAVFATWHPAEVLWSVWAPPSHCTFSYSCLLIMLPDLSPCSFCKFPYFLIVCMHVILVVVVVVCMQYTNQIMQGVPYFCEGALQFSRLLQHFIFQLVHHQFPFYSTLQ